MLEVQRTTRANSISQISPEFLQHISKELKVRGYNFDDPEFEFEFAQHIYQKCIMEFAEQDAPPLCEPISESQELALKSEADELYFGGIAGCGKTFLLLMCGATEHQSTIIFRREYTQLDDLIEKSRELLGQTAASFNGIKNVWRDVPGGRRIKFGACARDADLDKYQGREYDLVAFDEIATFTEHQYLFLSSWNRTIKKGQRVRIIGAGNPPLRSEFFWVKRRWGPWLEENHPNPAEPGELRWFARIDDKDVEVDGPDEIEHEGETIKPMSRTFIPGVMLDELREEYTAKLQRLKEPMRSQLLYGDFSIAEDDQALQVIPTSWVRLAMERWENMEKPEDALLTTMGVDVARGGDDQTIISKLYGNNYFGELQKFSGKQTKTGGEVAALVLDNIRKDEYTMKTENGREIEKKPMIVLDLSGIGASPYDIIVEGGFEVDGFKGGEASIYTDISGELGFFNRRAEAYWNFMEALDPESGKDIALPRDDELMADLTAPTWKTATNGKDIVIEKKEDIKKRIGRSTDCGDAVVMAYNHILHQGTVYF